MKKFMMLLETKVAPVMVSVNRNIWVQTFRDSIMQVMPFIFLGSLFCVFTILATWWPWAVNFWTPFGWTMGMIGFFMSVIIPLNYLEKRKVRKQRTIGALSGAVLYFIVLTPQLTAEGFVGFNHSAMGAGGMFVAMITGVFVSLVMEKLAKIRIFKEDSALPDFVKAWFDSMLPIAIVITAGWLVVGVLGVDLFGIITSVMAPLGNIYESWFGLVLALLLGTVLYSMGISGWILAPIFTPIELAAIQANMLGEAANIATHTAIYSTYLWVGGIGCTLPLCVMLLLSKSKKLKALGSACIVPSIFNINEPIVFGAIVMNPLLMVPMWLQAIVLPSIMWIFTKIIAFAPIPMMQFEMWYTPFPISTWITTRSINALILLGIIVLVSSLIWYPFFKVYEKQEIKLEIKE